MDKNKIFSVVILLAAAAGLVFFLYTYTKKKSPETETPSGGWTKAAPENYKTSNLLQQAASVTELGNNKLMLDIGKDLSKQLFGTGSGKVFVPKSTGTRFNAAPELLAKLQAKYGAGELFQKGKNLTDGFEWVTSTGITQLTFKDFVAISKA